MTKQEKIQEAYGKYWEQVKDYVNKNGWCSVRRGVGFDEIISNLSWETRTGNQYCWRPKSLKGIETNNGWIKIESEDDLPKENIECFFRVEVNERYSNAGVYINNGRFRAKSVLTSSENFFTVDDVIRNYYPKVTHYQPITKPQSPIY